MRVGVDNFACAVTGSGTYYMYYTDMETLTLVKIMKQGTSLCVALPSSILRQMGVERGSYLSLVVRDPGVLVLYPLTDADIRSLKAPSIQYD